MRFLIPASLLLSAVLCGGEASPAGSAIQITVPDMGRLIRDLKVGSLGAAGPLPEVRRWRDALVARYALDATWASRLERSGMLRAALAVGRVHGGLPAVNATLALLAAQDGDQRQVPGLHLERAGGWWLAGLGKPTLPELPRVSGQCQLAAVADLAAVAAMLPGDHAKVCRDLLAGLQLRQVQLLIQTDAGGTSEQGAIPGARLPLRPVDIHAMDGFPRPAFAMAIGIDGLTLGGVAGVLVALGLDEAGQAALLQATGQSPAKLAEGLDGTAAIAILPGIRPIIVATLPASPATDALLTALVEARQPGAGKDVIAAAAAAAVPVGWSGPFPLFIRRADNRWLLGSEGPQLEAIAADRQPIPIPEWQVLDQAVAVAWADPARLAGTLTLPPSLALLLGGQPGEGEAQLLAAVRAAYARIPVASLIAAQDADGLRWSGRNAIAPAIVAGVASLDVLLPAAADAYHRMARDEAGQRLVQIGERAIAFAKEMNGHWPGDLAELRAWARDLPDDVFASAGHPELERPFSYVPPAQSLPDQPILVQDPAGNGGAGSLVVYASGRLGYSPGESMWRDAQRLAALAQSRHGPVEIDEWTAIPKSF